MNKHKFYVLMIPYTNIQYIKMKSKKKGKKIRRIFEK